MVRRAFGKRTQVVGDGLAAAWGHMSPLALWQLFTSHTVVAVSSAASGATFADVDCTAMHFPMRVDASHRGCCIMVCLYFYRVSLWTNTQTDWALAVVHRLYSGLLEHEWSPTCVMQQYTYLCCLHYWSAAVAFSAGRTLQLVRIPTSRCQIKG